jgi:transcriptional regulator with XRE-family HTH domain
MIIYRESFSIMVGKTIRKIRQNRGLTIEQLAFESNMEFSQLCKIELGKVNTSIYQIYKIANGLNIPISELFKGSPETLQTGRNVEKPKEYTTKKTKKQKNEKINNRV